MKEDSCTVLGRETEDKVEIKENMMKISGDKSGNYKYDEYYKRNKYLSKWQWEDQRETVRSAWWRRAP